jgi:hypothetical protein
MESKKYDISFRIAFFFPSRIAILGQSSTKASRAQSQRDFVHMNKCNIIAHPFVRPRLLFGSLYIVSVAAIKSSYIFLCCADVFRFSGDEIDFKICPCSTMQIALSLDELIP